MSWSLKNGHLALAAGQNIHNIHFYYPQGVYFLEKYELSESVAFGQKLRYFTDRNGSKGGLHENEF